MRNILISKISDIGSIYWYWNRYLQIRKVQLSVIIGIGRYEKKVICRPLTTNLVLIPSILSDIYITGLVGTPTYIWIEKVFLTCKRDLYCYHNWKDSNMFWDHDDVGSSFPNLILLLTYWLASSIITLWVKMKWHWPLILISKVSKL